MRRRAPVLLLVLCVGALLVWYVVYTQRVVSELRREAALASTQYARAVRALADTSRDASTRALFEFIDDARRSDIPVIVTTPDGRIADFRGLPFVESPPGARTRAYMAELDRANTPLSEDGLGTVHYGDSRLVRGLRVIPLLQAGSIGVLLLAGLYMLRLRNRADRERVWAGMARESAHQLGTPLTSMSGWLELLGDREPLDPLTRQAVTNMKADLERLERVAHRFERIGRPPRRDEVDLAALAERIASYFRARVPTGTRAVTLNVRRPPEPLVVRGDGVLLEWVAEALTKNAIDALAGRGGTVEIVAEARAGGGATLRVADNGPGVPRELRRRIFDAGFTTKERGWGIGLSLARRIVEENHGGRLTLATSDRGAAFDVILE
jgi:signal transduction histidine kinase